MVLKQQNVSQAQQMVAPSPINSIKSERVQTKLEPVETARPASSAHIVVSKTESSDEEDEILDSITQKRLTRRERKELELLRKQELQREKLQQYEASHLTASFERKKSEILQRH